MIGLSALPWLRIAMISGIALAGAGAGAWMHGAFVSGPEIARLETRLDDANRRLGTCRGNVAGLQSSLDEQNAAVSALEARTEALEEARSEALVEAERAQASARDRLAAARAVPEGETACETATVRAAQFLWGSP